MATVRSAPSFSVAGGLGSPSGPPGFQPLRTAAKWPELAAPRAPSRVWIEDAPLLLSPLPVGMRYPAGLLSLLLLFLWGCGTQQGASAGCLPRRGALWMELLTASYLSLVGCAGPVLQGRPVQNQAGLWSRRELRSLGMAFPAPPCSALCSVQSCALGLAADSQRPRLCRLVPTAVPSGWLASIIT